MLRGKTRHELMPKEIADQHRANDLKVIADGRSIATEETNEEPDGRHVYWTVKFPLRDGQGKIYAIGGMSTDVTVHKRAEALIERETRFSQAALDSLPGLFYLFDEQGRFLRWNKNLERVSGCSAQEIAMLAPTAFFGDADKGAIAGAVEQVFLTGSATVVADFLSRDRSKIPHLFTGMRFLFDDKPCVIGMGIDITALKRAEAELRNSEERFRRAVTDSPFPALLHAEDGTVIQVSNAWCEITGYTPAELATIADWTERAYGERKELVQSDIDALYGLDRPKAEGDYSIRTRDGDIRIWGFSSAPLGSLPDGRRLVLSMAMDVTERRQAENEVRRLNDELEERVRQRTAELEASNNELEAFSYSVSHDLRAPLRAIDGFSRIVVDDYGDRLDDEGKRQLGVIRANTQKMGRLIDDLLAFSRAGRAALSCSRVAVANVVRAAFAEVAVDPEAQGRIDLSIGELPDAWADPALIRQVWVNLLSNAVKFSRTRERAAIRVTGGRDDHRVVYHVSDNGVGFDMRYVEKLFGVFQRLHSSREFEGTGVGLALVHRIVQRHGGEVWAEGVVDGGATFSFALPEEAGHERR